MRIGSLFSGIGGLELGVEWATGGETVWQCERDPYCRGVLARHWPDAQRYPDVQELEDPAPVDLLVGGFPCQDVSRMGGIYGQIKGIDGARSGLWGHFARLIGDLGPRLVFLENTPNLARRGLGTVLADLHRLGFDAGWCVLTAAAAGSPQTRARLFLLAHARGERPEQRGEPVQLVDPLGPEPEQDDRCHVCGCPPIRCGHCAYCAGSGEAWDPQTGEGPTCPGCGGSGRPAPHQWDLEPRFLTGPHGVSDRMALRALGNAVVPAQAAEAITYLAAREGWHLGAEPEEELEAYTCRACGRGTVEDGGTCPQCGEPG